MENIEYMRGRISAFKEMRELLSLAEPYQSVLNVLINHCNTWISIEERWINNDLLLMEEEAVKHGGTI